MKIVCDHCGAKYSISDEKVAGKVFKIRCKKCSEVLVVRGQASDEASPDAASSTDAVWHVVVEGQQQGPMTPAQLGGLFAKGAIDWDSYVWRDGFEDWKIARNVDELSELLEQANAAEKESARQDVEDDDIPIDTDTSSFEDQAMPSAASAMQGGATLTTTANESFTGKRNENSVLFSLGNLQQMAEQEQPAEQAPMPTAAVPSVDPGQASGEASGLIDIRALAASAAQTNTPQNGASTTEEPVDVFAANMGPASPMGLGAPIFETSPYDDQRKKMIWIGAAAAAGLALLVIALVFIFRDKPETVAMDTTNTQQGSTETTPKPDAKKPAPKPIVTPPVQTQAKAPETKPAATAETKKPAATKPKTTKPRRTKRTRKSTTTASTTRKSSKNKNLDALMEDVLGESKPKKRSSRTSSTSTSSNLPSTPSRSNVFKALSGLSGSVRACGKGKSGVANVAVVFSGSTGRATSAKVTNAPFKGTSVGKCVERAVKRARVPRFKQRTFKVGKFPYRI